MPSEFPFEAVEALTFESRPQPLSAALRPLYRVSLIVLVLHLNCSRGTASLLKLQFFNWVMKSENLRAHISRLSRTQSVFTLGIIHMDPMVNLAIKYAFSEGLVTVTRNSKYKLTDKGKQFTESIIRDSEEYFAAERELLEDLGSRISEVKLQRDLGLL
jgi:hypothetical protein